MQRDASPLVIAKDLTFRFHDRTVPALRECSFRISHWRSHSSVGTFRKREVDAGSLLTGLRSPASGLLLLDGLDRATVGAERMAPTRGCRATIS